MGRPGFRAGSEGLVSALEPSLGQVRSLEDLYCALWLEFRAGKARKGLVLLIWLQFRAGPVR